MDTRHALLDKYERWMRSWGAAEKTIEARTRTARTLLDDWPDLRDVTTEHLSDWLSRDMSGWSRYTYHGHLKALFLWLTDEGLVDSNPTLRLKKPQHPTLAPKPLSIAEHDRALSAATGNVQAWLLLAFLAGLRAHEIAKLAGQDVQEDYIYVRGKGGKEAFIPTHPALWTLAQEYPRSGWWFPSPKHDGHISGDTVTIVTGRLFRRVGITTGSIHRARHSYATTLLRAGTNVRVVQELMRHSSLATTAAYCQVDDDERRRAINGLGGAA